MSVLTTLADKCPHWLWKRIYRVLWWPTTKTDSALVWRIFDWWRA